MKNLTKEDKAKLHPRCSYCKGRYFDKQKHELVCSLRPKKITKEEA